MKRYLLSLIFICCLAGAQAQIGGTSVYQFLTLQPNARIAALGGSAIATYSNDLNLAVQNPALLRAEMSGQVSYNHVFYFADIQAGYVAYAHHFGNDKDKDSTNTFSAGIQYVNYGKFTQTDANGDVTGEFRAGDYSFNLAYSKKLAEGLNVGVQSKFIYSSLETYYSLGLALDAGMTYYMSDKLWTFSAVVSNLGRQLKSYTPDNSENIPLNVQLGASKKLKNAPFRFNIIANHLEKPGQLLYNNPDKPSLQKDLETGQTIPETFNFAEQVMSHITLSTELLLGKNFYAALGYNHLRRWEMKLKDTGGFSGFSWGFGFKISKFQFAYGSTTYIVGRSTNHISFIVNINDFKKKKS